MTTTAAAADAVTPRDGIATTTPDRIPVAAIRRSLPPHVFEKDAVRSIYYFCVDSLVIAACFRWYSSGEMGWLSYLIYANLTGLFMWCLFVVGHDAGHGTFSTSPVLNSIFGHLAHGFLLVPFHPWAKSHSLHHAYHNHKDKDRSHTWIAKEEEGWDVFFKDWPFAIPVAYGFGYLLFGIPDGSHYHPFSKLFSTTRERLEATLSIAVCIVFLYTLITVLGSSFWAAYFIPWLIYNTWLYAVTYLQHHGDRTKVYGASEWSFGRGAVETVDRVYDVAGGALLDSVMHNITDGHVVHHFFSTSIPHYNLLEATAIVRPQLGSAYQLVKGFPLMELLMDHWYTTRPWLLKAKDDLWVLRRRGIAALNGDDKTQ